METFPELTPEQEQEYMSDEQLRASEIRAKHHRQNIDPFDDTLAEGGSHRKRRMPTLEERERIKQAIIELGNLFEGSDIHWLLDGAINISLLKGELIGSHQDVDVSVDEADLKKLDAWLSQKGYGLFTAGHDIKQEDGKLVWTPMITRVDSRGFVDSHDDHEIMAPIDSEGKMLEGQKLPFIHTHILEKTARKAVPEEPDISLPEKWLEPYPVEYEGTTINVSHPARVAYNKIYGEQGEERLVDIKDVEHLVITGALTASDLDELETLFNQMEDNDNKAMEERGMRHRGDRKRLIKRINQMRALLPGSKE